MTLSQIILGICLLSLGIYGILENWWLVVDFAGVIIPSSLIIFGAIAVFSGINAIKERVNHEQ